MLARDSRQVFRFVSAFLYRHINAATKPFGNPHFLKESAARSDDIMVHAVLIRKTGPPDVLELVDDYEKPTISDGEVWASKILET